MKKTLSILFNIFLCVLLVANVVLLVRARRPLYVDLSRTDKLHALLALIDNHYVEGVDRDSLVEQAMLALLSELDPHSVYIPAADLEATNNELAGSFSGIGIQFMLQQDTIYVTNVIHGGPAEKVGIFPGDRFVTIDDSLFVGPTLTNESAMSHLKGPKGTTVTVGVRRNGESNLLPFTIVRGDIPVKSIDAAYLIDGTRYGLLSVTKFGETTYAEMLSAIANLLRQGMEGLIIDLRDNTGGYMAAAMQMLNEFLPKDQVLVYTEGDHSPRQYYNADGTGSCRELPLVVLTNEISASASEIFAGAIQDNDRGLIVGRRTFGKGLVQQPFEFSDGSAVRLTVARYFTPSGRCIQKPYTRGDDPDYQLDILTRYEHGEFFSRDSIRQDESTAYQTLGGRTVYGGGGIMPDIFVAQDTAGFNAYYMALSRSGLFRTFTFSYTDSHRAALSAYTTVDALEAHLRSVGLLEQFIAAAERKGIARPTAAQLAEARHNIETVLYGNIIYNMLSMQEYLRFLNRTDPIVQTAIHALDDGIEL